MCIKETDELDNGSWECTIVENSLDSFETCEPTLR